MDELDETLSEEDILKDIAATTDTLVTVIGVCEETRQFMAVARLAIKKGNPKMASTLLSLMIDRLDPLLQNYYKDIPDTELIDEVSQKMGNPKLWPDDMIDRVVLDDADLKEFQRRQAEGDEGEETV